MSTIKINTCDKDWFGRDYVFYNSLGNPININYDNELGMYYGRQFFPENSSDTFKELEINIFERIKGFEYRQYDSDTEFSELYTQKFQLFNTERIEFNGNNNRTGVTKIEVVVNDPNFNSKWIYGDKIDSLFPYGTVIKFSRSIFTFNINETFVVIGHKQGAIMVITSDDNKSFVDNIGGTIDDESMYDNLYVSGTNVIRIYNYINKDYSNSLPDWSEPNFYTQLFEGRKLTLVGTKENDGVYTVKNRSLGDNYYSNYKININELDLDSDLIIELTNNTSNFRVMGGGVELISSDKIMKLKHERKIPELLKPGTDFIIPLSTNNDRTLTVSSVPLFNSITTTEYSDGTTTGSLPDQVLYNGRIYHCIKSYQQNARKSRPESGPTLMTLAEQRAKRLSDNDTSVDNVDEDIIEIPITPDDSEYWTLTDFIYLEQDINDEVLNSMDIYLTTNKRQLHYTYDQNIGEKENLATCFEIYRDELELFGITPIIYEDGQNVYGSLNSIYATNYISVEYIISGTSSNFTEHEQIIERVIEVEEDLVNEINTDLSIRPAREVVIDDIDNFGLTIIINEQIYDIESTLVMTGSSVDQENSIKNTIENWVELWKGVLEDLGIEVETLNDNTLYIKGVYPNIELDVDVRVGDTANFFFPDKDIEFNSELGGESSILSIIINYVTYSIPYRDDTETTLQDWVTTHSEILHSYGIYVENDNKKLIFTKKTNIDINIEIDVGKLYYPGNEPYTIREYWVGNQGMLIASNSIIQFNNDISFTEECFSTGQIISINDSGKVLDDQEYNVLYLDPSIMILSYQGPFWGTLDNEIQSGFSALAFGEDLDIGEYIEFVVDNITYSGEVTGKTILHYQVRYDINKVVVIDRQSAWGWTASNGEYYDNEGGLNPIELPETNMYLKTRDFIRRPRANYSISGDPVVNWEFRWDKDNVDDIFMVDISGKYLENRGMYKYIGEKPLKNPTLRRNPNTNIELVDKDYAQQTIFPVIEHELCYNDATEDGCISLLPNGIQTFFGFNSSEEGVRSSKLRIIKKEDIRVEYQSFDNSTLPAFDNSTHLPEQYLTFRHNEESGMGELELNGDSTDTFISIVDKESGTTSKTGLKQNQDITIRISSNPTKGSEDKGRYLSRNDNMDFRIYRIYERRMVLIYLDQNRVITDESTKVSEDNEDSIKGSSVIIGVIPTDIINIDFYGQTEIEDIRYKTELSNTGNQVNPEDVFIFKEYDINEGGMDWNFLNNKRKEMLMVRNDIFNYIGSYKSIINSINYFGYNDLELYEYFRNIDIDADNYMKLSKIEIPDIFDNSSDKWVENFKGYQYPNEYYEDTNLFNLTYRFTDFDGNNRQTYSLEDAIIKLSGLKRWLEKNIVPITHKILDITGRTDFRNDHQIYYTPSSVINYKTDDYITPVDFDINEIYALPVQSGSVVYNAVVDFKVGSLESMVDYFSMKIRTYRIHPEWDVFHNYEYLDRVTYFGKVYENILVDNSPTAIPGALKSTNNNPREYDSTQEWGENILYQDGDVVRYDRRYYNYSPLTDTVNYPPWSDDGDSFYTDLWDAMDSESVSPIYWTPTEYNDTFFDIMCIIEDKYEDKWNLFLKRDEEVLHNIVIDMINMPETEYDGDKPSTQEAAFDLLNRLIEKYTETKSMYKLKYLNTPPMENILLDEKDFILWRDITKWLEVDLEPVQTIDEYRSGEDMLLPYNLTIDSSIDPYIVISCVSNNGYGQIKNIEKSYEIKFDADADSVLIKNIR